jgi:hypothetical protein
MMFFSLFSDSLMLLFFAVENTEDTEETIIMNFKNLVFQYIYNASVSSVAKLDTILLDK